MSDRRLVIAEADPRDPHYGELRALAPNNATGVAIPSFRIGTSLPPVGSTNGEGFYDTTTRQGYVWDGATWRDIAANPIIQFATDADLLADTTAAVGSYAIASSSGNLYVKQPTGWGKVGIALYNTAADLLADSPSQGTIAEALDEGSLWQRTATNWRCTGVRIVADTAAVLAWTGTSANTGDQAFASDKEILYARVGSSWRPVTIWEETEANIRAATWCLDGQEAIATDTGRTFARVSGAWIEEPIQHYATQAALLAATPPDGTLAWADDTQHVFTRAAGQWSGINTGFDDPLPIGALVDFPVRAIPNGWLECNGAAIPADAKYNDLKALLGTATVPDYRGLFARAAKAGETLSAKVNWTTGQPKTSFTTDSQGNHHHVSGYPSYNVAAASVYGTAPIGGGKQTANWDQAATASPLTNSEGAHTHTITGGDAETAPDHYKVVRCIKAFHITVAKPAPDAILTALVAPKAGDVLAYDAGTSSWVNHQIGEPVGTICQSLLTDAQFAAAQGPQAANWVLADGRDVAGSRYATITGSNKVPDLRGAFLRGAGQNANPQWTGPSLRGYQEDSTARPKTAFTTDSQGDHFHNVGLAVYNGDANSSVVNGYNNSGVIANRRTVLNGGSNYAAILPGTDTKGAHTHTITGGGDTETRPKNYGVNYFIRIN